MVLTTTTGGRPIIKTSDELSATSSSSAENDEDDLGHLVVSKLSFLKRRATQHDESFKRTVPDAYVLVISLGITKPQLESRQSQFLQKIALSTGQKDATCAILDAKKVKSALQTLEVYCRKTTSKASADDLIDGKDLVRLFETKKMAGFLQDYNITKYYVKRNVEIMTLHPNITEEVWFPVAAVATATFLFMIVMAVVVCFFKRSKNRKDGGSTSHSNREKHDTFVCHTIKPIDTMSPTMVQPQMKDLYTIHGSPRKVQKWSGDREHKRPGLLQSRRGSQASLVIDLTPGQNIISNRGHESPTEESLLSMSKYMKFRDLEDEKENTELLFREFWAIPTNTVHRRDKQSMSNASLKNRYPDYIPNPKTAVQLKLINGDPNSTYINANYIRGYGNAANMYIATEGPLQSTVANFWRMIWEQKCQNIVMITKLKEKNEEKCAEYWPSPNSKTQVKYDDITVTFDSKVDAGGYVITKLYISHGKFLEESRLITHYWFTSWPDHKVPKSCSDIISLAKDVRSAVDTAQHTKDCGPVVVHCSAGRGRTGCFIAICHAMEQVEDEQVANILKIVSTMRLDRGGMVQKDEQYIFIHKTIYEYWKDLKSHSPSLSSILPAGIETAQEEQEESPNEDVFQGSHFVW
eukprot:gene11401-21599_t